ncbi:cyclin-like protein, partial [Mycena albidolilacea]
WEDLDAADWDDPMMASEYVADIQRYLKEVEVRVVPYPHHPSPTHYMASQTAFTWDMRASSTTSSSRFVHTRFHLPETLFLSTHLIDRFLSLRAVAPGKLQLVGMACLLLASKYEETVSPAIANFTQISDGAFSNAEMQQAEQNVLRTLGWDLSYPSPIHWLRRVSKAERYQTQTRQLGKYLAEIVLVEERLVGTPPSLLAAAAMWLVRLALGEGDWLPRAYVLWTPTLAHYATYAEAELLPAARRMLRYVLQPVRHESFYRKWAGKRNMKVSVYMREWALARWAEGSRPDLALELPALKREMRALQVRKEREAEAKRVRGEAGAEGGEEEDGDAEEDAEE